VESRFGWRFRGLSGCRCCECGHAGCCGLFGVRVASLPPVRLGGRPVCFLRPDRGVLRLLAAFLRPASWEQRPALAAVALRWWLLMAPCWLFLRILVCFPSFSVS